MTFIPFPASTDRTSRYRHQFSKLIQQKHILAVVGRLPLLLLIFLLVQSASGTALAKTIRVGVYDNKPLVFKGSNGKYQGFAMDILRHIAEKEGFNLQLVEGTWSQCLERLKNGEIDLQVAIASSAERRLLFDFTENALITNWGRLYCAAGSHIDSLLVLDNKKVAVLEGDIHAKVFNELMEKFELHIEVITYDNYDNVLLAVQENKADCGLVNRLYAMANSHRFKVEQTPVIFNPIEVRYGAPKNKDNQVLQIISAHLQELKNDKQSIYYNSLSAWFGDKQHPLIPKWVTSILLIAVALFAVTFIIALFFKHQVTKKTSELEEKQTYLQSIFNASNDAIFIHDADTGAIIDVNQAMLEIYGVSYEEATQMTPDQASLGEPPYSAEEAQRYIHDAVNKGPQVFDWIARRKDGSLFWAQVSLRHSVFRDKGIVIAVVRDIDERKKAEEKLAAEQERLAVTLRSIGDGVITSDLDGNVVFLNQVAENLTGWKNEAAQGKPVVEVFHIINEKTRKRCENPINKVLEIGKIIGLANHTALIAKDGVERSIADSAAPIRDRKSRVIGVVLVFRDVTNEQRMEQELLKIKKLESVGVLAGGIAHDFNNILAAILGNIELARIVKNKHKVAQLLRDAEKATMRATKLTQQFLTFSKGGDPIKETASLPQIIEESAEFVLHGSKVSCTYNFPDDLLLVDIDTGQIGQVIQNIVLNARHAMPEGGRIEIACANITDAAKETLLSIHAGEFVRVTIKDHGIGIPEAVIDKIFDPYFSTKQEGSGLGLATCHAIVSKHDGYLTVNSVPGQGSVFSIYLPASTSKDGGLTEQQKVSISLGTLNILVMDDEEMFRHVLKSQLNHLGHEVVLTANGEEAVNTYRTMWEIGSPFDLTILDLTIPGAMGGKEAVGEIHAINPVAKVIVASGYSSDPVIANYREYGFRAATGKPFNLTELRQAITQAFV